MIDDKLLKQKIIESFPFVNEKGTPAFRPFQAKAIYHMAKSILASDKKFHMIEGPVGSGKSVINYTAAIASVVKILEGKCTMLTSMKSLQDQIAAEGWDEIKSLKGKSGYACSHCQSLNSIRIKANYDGEEETMCNNSGAASCSKSFKQKVEEVRGNVGKMISDGDEVTLRFKTNFSSVKEFDKLLPRVVSYFRKIYEEETAKPPEERMLKYKNAITFDECIEAYGSDSFVVEKINNDAINAMSCCMRGNKIEAIECGARSARVLSRVLGIRLLNPDIFYYLTMNPSSFSSNNAMIIDEAHGWASVMNRIFDINVPVDALKMVYGVDLTDVYKVDDKLEILNKLIDKGEYFAKIHCAIKVVRKLGTMMYVRRPDHIRAIVKSKTKIAQDFVNFANCWFIDNQDKDFDLFPMVDKYVFQNVNDYDKYYSNPFFKSLRVVYEEYVMKNNEKNNVPIENSRISILGIRNSIINWVGRDMKLFISRETKNVFGRKHSYDYVSKNAVCGSYLIKLRDFINKFIRVCSVVSKCFDTYKIDGEDHISTAFGVYKKTLDGTQSISNTPLQKLHNFEREKRVRSLNISVVNPGKIARMFFYSKTEKVIFTSGTWVHLDSMKRSLGINSGEYEFYRMPSTFDKNRRPIYIVDKPSLTNFSERTLDKKGYVYKTEEGALKFVNDTKRFVETIQAFIKKEYGVNPNILIHSHSFILTRLMVEYGVYGENWFFHTNSMSEYVRNKVTGMQVATHEKDSTINLFRDSHDKGYVFVSPSITEGVDFKHGAARAQIILKFPIPNIVDPYVKTISKGDKELGVVADEKYIDRLIWSTLTQAYGRVMRDEKDWGFTFLMDQIIPKRFSWILSKWNKAERININNPYFFEAIRCKYTNRGKPQFVLPFEFK